jgi:hypothetical protein
MTVFDPSCCKGSVNNSMSVASALKFGMSDNIFEKAVPPAVPQEIWCGDQHASRNDLAILGGHKNSNSVIGQPFGPDFLGSLLRLRAEAHLRYSIEFEHRSKIGRNS